MKNSQKPRRPLFINRYGQGQRETVSEIPHKGSYRVQLTEARKERDEYILSDSSAQYWVSTRACRDWLDR